MNKILAFIDRAWHCLECDTRTIPETDIQLGVGRCPVCGEFGMMEQAGTVTIFAKNKEYYNYKTGRSYFIREPYYPTDKEKYRLMYQL